MQIPADAWQVGPWNRYAYTHVSEVVPTVPVACGETRPLRIEPVELDLELDPCTDGIAVVRDGALVYERYGGEMDERSLHLSQSVGKSVVGLTAGIVGVDPAAPVTEFVPEIRGSGYDGATVRHLLNMTAAIDFVEDYQSFVAYDAACGWHPPHPDVPGTILEYLPTIGPATWAHGERFHYATPNTDLLGIVAERLGGAPLAELIARELWAPLGAEHDALLTVDHAGTAAIGGGFCATLRDYARLGELVRLGDFELGAGGYSNQWWTIDGRVTAQGIHGQRIAVGRDTVVAILSSWPEAEGLDESHRALVAGACDSAAEG